MNISLHFSGISDPKWNHWVIISARSVFFLGNYQTLLRSRQTISHPFQQHMSNPVSLHSCQSLVLSLFIFLSFAIPIVVQWFLMVFTCIFLTIHDDDHLSGVNLSAVCIFFSEMSLHIFAHVLIELSAFYHWVSRNCCTSTHLFYVEYVLYFFILWTGFLIEQMFFILMKPNLSVFSFHGLCF